MWTALIPLAFNLISGVVSKSSHDKYAKELEEQKMEMPESMKGAEEILKHTAGTGLPGAESMKEEVMANLAQTIQSGREIGTPSAMLGLLNQSSAKASQQLRQINIQDEDAKLRGKMALANFFMSAKAPMEWRMKQFDIEKNLAVQKEKMAGTSELLGGISQGIGGMFGVMGQEKENEFLEEYLGILKGYYGTGGAESGQQTGVQSGASTPISNQGVGAGFNLFDFLLGLNPNREIY